MTDENTRLPSELLPCPFCGHEEPLLITHSSDAGNEYSVRCYQGCCEIGDEYKDEAVKEWNTRKALASQPRDDVRELLRDIADDLRPGIDAGLADPYIIVELRALCERAGYGNVMNSASALWRERLGELAGGEFVSGPCRKTLENLIARIDTALAPTTQGTDSGLAGGLLEAAKIAEEWRDDNKAAAAKEEKTGSREFAAELRTAAVECNALAGHYRALAEGAGK